MSDNETPMTLKPGHISWNELTTTDPTSSASFYGKLFGWQTVPFVVPGGPTDEPPYMVFKTDAANATDPGVGGMMAAPTPGVPTHWIPYVVVKDADVSLAKAVELGAKALMPVMAIGEVGRVAVIQDPLGAVIGLHEFPR